MAKLPPAVLERIVAKISHDYVDSPNESQTMQLSVAQTGHDYLYPPNESQTNQQTDPNRSEYKQDLRTLRSLRLVNRDLCALASRRLFEKVVLHYTEASYDKMMLIAQHPKYRHYVRSLGISPKAISGPYKNMNAFEEWLGLKENRLIENGSYSLCSRIPDAMRYLHTRDIGDVGPHHANYTRMFKAQETMVLTIGDQLERAIRCFPGLKEVYPTMRTHPTEIVMPYTKEDFVNDMWQQKACMYRYDYKHGTMILKALARSGQFVKGPIDISRLLDKIDTTTLSRMVRLDIEQLQKMLAHSKKLSLSLQTYDTSGLARLLESRRYERFLGGIKTLESVRCSTFELAESALPVPKISDVFGKITWRRLHRLELSRFDTSARILSELLCRHHSTLRELILQHILLFEGSWYEVFSKLRSKGALRDVKVYHLDCEEDPSIFFRDIEELRADQIPSIRLLENFFFRKGPWYQRVEADMRQRLELLNLDDEALLTALLPRQDWQQSVREDSQPQSYTRKAGINDD